MLITRFRDRLRPFNSRNGLQLLLGIVIVVNVGVLTGCNSGPKLDDKQVGASKDPVLTVEQAPYKFTMYPLYKNESESLLFLDIEVVEEKEKEKAFIHNAAVLARLVASDGDTQTVKFKEDSKAPRYVASVPLKHHEDYVVETEIKLPEKEQQSMKPTFSFHCADPLPELEYLEKEGALAK